MMTFVKNKEELSGVLCHEVSHTIHHDVYDLYVKSQRVSLWATLAQLLLARNSSLTAFAINFLANVQVLRFSRDVEHNADVTGAYICGESGVTPWGLVWLMKRFLNEPKSNPPEFLSDHPTDSHRISDLERLFAENPQTFERFNSEIANATPLDHPGLREQYKVVEATPAPVAPLAVTKPATPKPRTKPTCPPGWKFCPRTD
jgi:predicted Zn-dependent protease